MKCVLLSLEVGKLLCQNIFYKDISRLYTYLGNLVKLILKASVQCDVSLKSIYRTCRIHVQEEVVGCM